MRFAFEYMGHASLSRVSTSPFTKWIVEKKLGHHSIRFDETVNTLWVTVYSIPLTAAFPPWLLPRIPQGGGGNYAILRGQFFCEKSATFFLVHRRELENFGIQPNEKYHK